MKPVELPQGTLEMLILKAISHSSPACCPPATPSPSPPPKLFAMNKASRGISI
jgi:hypothetical protein